LLQAALRQLLGNHYQVIQKGSSVDSKRLRFDFTYFEQLNSLQLRDIEHVVNQQIRANLKVTTKIMDINAAKNEGAIALFDEKYGDQVRVIYMGDFSKELCGGTHVKETGTIGLFKIIAESGVAAGVRRIEAVTGENALLRVEANEISLLQIEQLLKTSGGSVVEKVKQLLENAQLQEKEISNLKAKLASSASKDLLGDAEEINGIKILATKIENVDAKTLRTTLDELKQKLDTAVIVLATVINDKIQIIVGITKNLTDKLNANALMQHIAQQIDGSGGGRPDMAQGGGTNIANLPNALASVIDWVKINQ
jgi:alanyl-tRNA synthetase